LKFQIMLMTGMLMLGKISVGVRTIASPPMIKMSMDTTTNVYGRRNASRTIHIESVPSLSLLACRTWQRSAGQSRTTLWLDAAAHELPELRACPCHLGLHCSVCYS